jgi:hypothetical protein
MEQFIEYGGLSEHNSRLLFTIWTDAMQRMFFQKQESPKNVGCDDRSDPDIENKYSYDGAQLGMT